MMVNKSRQKNRVNKVNVRFISLSFIFTDLKKYKGNDDVRVLTLGIFSVSRSVLF